MSAHVPHDHAERVPGCFRCDLAANDTARATIEDVAAATGQSVEAVAQAAERLRAALGPTEAMQRAERALLEAWHGTVGRAFHPRRPDEARATVTAALAGGELAAVFVEHAPNLWSSGEIECRCGGWRTRRAGLEWEMPTHAFRADAWRAYADHVADEQRAAILGRAA